MSELQIGLLAIGALVVAGVLGYNRIQERGAKRAAERAFRSGHADVLLVDSPRESAAVPEAVRAKAQPAISASGPQRSEERRVGKECRL